MKRLQVRHGADSRRSPFSLRFAARCQVEARTCTATTPGATAYERAGARRRSPESTPGAQGPNPSFELQSELGSREKESRLHQRHAFRARVHRTSGADCNDAKTPTSFSLRRQQQRTGSARRLLRLRRYRRPPIQLTNPPGQPAPPLPKS
jgi:hypothetical protein